MLRRLFQRKQVVQKPPSIFRKIRVEVVFGILLCCFSSCNPICLRDNYHEQYRHVPLVRAVIRDEKSIIPAPHYLLVLVDAKHLDYSSPETFIATMAKHPDGSRTKDFGHAWIVLCGPDFYFEGGHSGEVDVSNPKYLDAIFTHQEDENPIRFLFQPRMDGYLEKGSGGHAPTFALYVPLSEETFLHIASFVREENYNYTRYSLTESQCTTFVVKAASIAGLNLEAEASLPVPSSFSLQGTTIYLWKDPRYRTIDIATPDILEKSLALQPAEDKGMCALNFYKNSCKIMAHN